MAANGVRFQYAFIEIEEHHRIAADGRQRKPTTAAVPDHGDIPGGRANRERVTGS